MSDTLNQYFMVERTQNPEKPYKLVSGCGDTEVSFEITDEEYIKLQMNHYQAELDGISDDIHTITQEYEYWEERLKEKAAGDVRTT